MQNQPKLKSFFDQIENSNSKFIVNKEINSEEKLNKEIKYKNQDNLLLKKVNLAKQNSKDSNYESKEQNIFQSACKNDKIFNNPEDLFDYIIQNNELISFFLDEIKSIIKLMHEILYDPPYNILFGRINVEQIKMKIQENCNSSKNIDKSFYDGFD